MLSGFRHAADEEPDSVADPTDRELIYAVGDVSGAHLNPAVTLGFFVARRFPGHSVLPYVASQCAGALLASLALRLMFPTNATLGATLPAGDCLQSFVLEAVLTFLLMFVILSVSTGSKEKGVLAGVAVGSVIALEALFAGPVCGASMNPARSLGPAVLTARLDVLWLYLLGPALFRSVTVFRRDGSGVDELFGESGRGENQRKRRGANERIQSEPP